MSAFDRGFEGRGRVSLYGRSTQQSRINCASMPGRRNSSSKAAAARSCGVISRAVWGSPFRGHKLPTPFRLLIHETGMAATTQSL